MFVETCVCVCVCDVVGRQAVHHHIICCASWLLLLIFQIEGGGGNEEEQEHGQATPHYKKKREGKNRCTHDVRGIYLWVVSTKLCTKAWFDDTFSLSQSHTQPGGREKGEGRVGRRERGGRHAWAVVPLL